MSGSPPPPPPPPPRYIEPKPMFETGDRIAFAVFNVLLIAIAITGLGGIVLLWVHVIGRLLTAGVF